MSLFFRAAQAAELRDVSMPFNYGSALPKGGGTMEGNLSLVPVYAATRLIADSVSTLPLQAYRRTDTGRVPIAMPLILRRPDVKSTRTAWVQRAMMSLLLRGNAYGWLLGQDSTGAPTSIVWLDPDLVQQRGSDWFYSNRIIPREQLLHIPALVLPGSDLGVSPMAACRQTVMAGQETQRFVADWFRNKALPGLLFKNTERTLDADVAGKAKERLKSTLRSGEPFVTGKDWSLDVIKLPADDAGFVQSTRMTATQIASVYGVPPEMIGGEAAGSLTYSTVELNQIQFLTNTLRPWLVRLEEAFSTLLGPGEYVKFNADAMIRADTKTRWEVHQIARNIGATSVNEIRALEDWEPLPAPMGDDYTPLAAPALAPTQDGTPA